MTVCRSARPAKLAAALVLWMGGVCLGTCAFAQAKPAAASANVAPVRFLVVAAQESILSASVAGRIANVPVGLGDSVRAGQVVASFDCAEVQARRGAARGG